MPALRRHLYLIGLFALGLVTSGMPSLAGSTASTTPQGCFTVNIAAGTGTSRTLTVLSFPLQTVSYASGIMSGVITTVTSNTLTNSSAGWGAGLLSEAATPSLIQITSGAAAGRYFLISTTTANTATTVTLDSTETTDLTTLGIKAGIDTYQIIPADTILSAFGTPGTTGILGGTSATSADNIQVYTTLHGWTTYYYNTSLANWYQSGAPIASGNLVLRPDCAVIYGRLGATGLAISLLGQVPSLARQSAVNNGGTTVLSSYWPADLTLGSSNIQKIPGWVTSSSSSTADVVQIYTALHGWTQYYNNGTDWIQVGAPIISDSVVIPAGSGVLIVKQGSAGGQSVLSQNAPYSL